MIAQDTLTTLTTLPVPPLAVAPTALTGAIFGAGALMGLAMAVAFRWASREARRARAATAVGGQLVVVRAADGSCEALAVPPRLAPLFTGDPHPGEPLPPWLPEMEQALAALDARAGAPQEGTAVAEVAAAGLRLRLVGVRAEADTLLVSIAEAGPDAARVNRLETAALLSGGLAHDLRNVLNTLVLHAEVGSDHIANGPKVLTHLERIRGGAQRAADMVSLLRKQLRGNVGGTGQPVAVPVATAVREVVELLRPAFPRALHLDCSALDDHAVVLAVEPVQVHQIVLNLVLNAVQAMEHQPAPRLRLAAAVERPVGGPDGPAAGEDARPRVLLVVEDNGPGLPPEVRARCFEPYFTTRAGAGGTGLGLAVVRALAEDALGGEVRVDEAQGGGARFEVRVPAAPHALPGGTDAAGGDLDAVVAAAAAPTAGTGMGPERSPAPDPPLAGV